MTWLALVWKFKEQFIIGALLVGIMGYVGWHKGKIRLLEHKLENAAAEYREAANALAECKRRNEAALERDAEKNSIIDSYAHAAEAWRVEAEEAARDAKEASRVAIQLKNRHSEEMREMSLQMNELRASMEGMEEGQCCMEAIKFVAERWK